LSTHIRPYLFLSVLALAKGSVLALLLALFIPILSGKSGTKFLGLLSKLAQIGFLELGKILKFPFYGWQLRQVATFHQRPVGFAGNQTKQKSVLVWRQCGGQFRF
jgi:hypothetical protein